MCVCRRDKKGGGVLMSRYLFQMKIPFVTYHRRAFEIQIYLEVLFKGKTERKKK